MKRKAPTDVEDLNKIMNDMSINEKKSSKKARNIEEDLDFIIEILESSVIKERNQEQERKRLVELVKLLNYKLVNSKILTKQEKKEILEDMILYKQFVNLCKITMTSEEKAKKFILEKINNYENLFQKEKPKDEDELKNYEMDFVINSYFALSRLYLWLKSVEDLDDWGLMYDHQSLDKLLSKEP